MRKKLAAIMLLLAFTCLLGQENTSLNDLLEKNKTRKFYKRQEWFFKQRAAPFDTISSATLNREFEKEKEKIQTDKSKSMQWLPLGPKGIHHSFPVQWGGASGRCRALDIHPQNPDIVYIGAASGGIWKTINGGESWAPVSDNFNTITFGAICIDPNNPNTVYAGTGEGIAGASPFNYYGDGLYKTTDGGTSWSKIGLELDGKTHFNDIVVCPYNSNLVFAAIGTGNMYVTPPEKTGIWKSTNAGQSWVKTFSTDNAFDLEYHLQTAGTIYAAIGGAGADAGFYISYDNGSNWTKSSSGLPASTSILRMQFSVSQSNPQIIYALPCVLGSGSTTSVPYRSTNAGVSWSLLPAENPIGGYYSSQWNDQGFYDLCIAVKPDDPEFVLAGNIELHKKTNTTNFAVTRYAGSRSDIWGTPVHCDYHRIVFSKSNPQIVYIVNDGGIYKSVDGGNNWTHKNNGISTIQFYAIASHPTDRTRLMGGAQDNGNFVTVDGGLTNWEQSSTGDGMNGFYDYSNPNTVYFSVQNGTIFKSTNGGTYNSLQSITPAYVSGESPFWCAPFFIHPTNAGILYVASDRLWKSTNSGSSWQPVSARFPVSISAIDQNRLYPQVMILADGGNFSANTGVYVSTDEGLNWAPVTANIPGPARYISNVKTDPYSKNRLYIVRSGFGSGKIYKSDDFGRHWVDISGNLPDVPCNDLFIDPKIPGHLYAANDFGVYQSTDGGMEWSRINNGMPVVPVIDLDYAVYGTTRLLRAGTYGRSAYEVALPNASSKYLFLVGPQGGEKIPEGSSFPIQWSCNNISRINIYFSKDNKVTWQPIALDYPADSLRCNWRLPAGVADSCYIKIEDKLDPQYTQTSSSAFSIVMLPAPLLLRPLNGEGGYNIEPAIFEWTPSPGADIYSLHIATDSLFLNTVYSDSMLSVNYKTISGLQNYRKYFWRIGFRNESVPYKYSETFSFTTQVARPTLIFPANSAMDIPLSVDLKWDTVNGADRYHLQVAKNILFTIIIVSDSAVSSNIRTVSDLSFSSTYYWRVRAGNQYGFSKYSEIFKFRTSLVNSLSGDGKENIPDRFDLFNNYPNPFNPATIITYSLPERAHIILTIYNSLGERVAELFNGEKAAGTYSAEWNAGGCVSGIYICQLKSAANCIIKKLILLK